MRSDSDCKEEKTQTCEKQLQPGSSVAVQPAQKPDLTIRAPVGAVNLPAADWVYWAAQCETQGGADHCEAAAQALMVGHRDARRSKLTGGNELKHSSGVSQVLGQHQQTQRTRSVCVCVNLPAVSSGVSPTCSLFGSFSPVQKVI